MKTYLAVLLLAYAALVAPTALAQEAAPSSGSTSTAAAPATPATATPTTPTTPTPPALELSPPLMSKILAVQKQGQLLWPKFKQISYTLQIGERTWQATVRNQGGAVHVTDASSSDTVFRGLYAGGGVLLASSLDLGGQYAVDGIVTQDATLSVNPHAKKGEPVFMLNSMRSKSGSAASEAVKSQTQKVTLTCHAGDKFNARQIHPSLTGQALVLHCKGGMMAGDTVTFNQALLLDLGWVLDYERPGTSPGADGKPKIVYPDITIEQ